MPKRRPAPYSTTRGIPNTCHEQITSGAARWVTTFTTNSSSYDAQGNLTWFGRYPVSRDAPNPPWLHPVTLTYDVTYQGLVASTTNALNQTTRYTYDAAGRLLTTTDPNNQTTTVGYDVYGRPETYAPPGVGLYQTRWSYPGIDPVRGYRVQEFTYASPTSSHQARVCVDGFGGLAQTLDYTGTSLIPIETLSHEVWDSGQRVRRASWPYYAGDSPAKFIQTTFDARGRPLRIARVKNDAGFTTDNTASGRPAVYTFTHSRSGDKRVTTHTDANGNSRSVYSDYRGLVTQVTDAAGDMTYRYTTALRLAQVTLPSTRAAFRDVSYTYDSWGRLKTEHDPNGEGFVAYTYDDASMLTKKTYYASPAMTTRTREIWYSYDQLARLQRERARSSPFSDLVTYTTYTYDETSQQNGIGRLTTVTDTSGTTTFNYDGRGNVTSKVITLNGLNGSVTYSYAYDDSDRVTGMVFPDAVQKFIYTVDGVLTGVTHNDIHWGSWKDFDAFKRATTFQAYDNGGWTNTTAYTFDVDQRVSRIVQQKSGRVIQALSYGYDAVGNVTTITDNRATKVLNGINTDLTQSFAYDALGRLCAIWSTFLAAGACTTTSPAPSAIFTYDGVGNLFTDSGTTNTYTMIGSECVIENRRPLPLGDPSLSTTGTVAGRTILNWRAYQDTEGKRTRFEDCSVSPCVNYYYGYDYRGRLTSVTQDGVVRERYAYDFADRRTKKSYNNLHNTAHAWFFGPSYTVRKNSADLARTAKTLSIAGIATHTYGDKIPGAVAAATVDTNINQPFTGSTDQALPVGIYLRQSDLLGSQTVMTRASDGAVVSRNRYDAWGSHLAANSMGQDTTYEQFTGQPREAFSGLAYYGFRYYHPTTRRFITPDDRIMGCGAQGYNRFAYVHNNPATYIDPTGHQTAGTSTCVGKGCGDDRSGSGSGSNSGLSGGWNEICSFSLICSGIRWLVESGDNREIPRVKTSDVTPDYEASPKEPLSAKDQYEAEEWTFRHVRYDRGPSTIRAISDDEWRQVQREAEREIAHRGRELQRKQYCLRETGNESCLVANIIPFGPPGGVHLARFQTFKTEAQLADHFTKHAPEWGAGNITPGGYLRRAETLLNRPPGGNILSYTGPNGDILRYNTRTNEFAVGSADGFIRTLFRPDRGVAYWLQQIGP